MSVVASFQSGKPGARYARKAAEEVLKVAEAVPPRDVIETVLAVFVMQELEPRRFRSDPGFPSSSSVACGRSRM